MRILALVLVLSSCARPSADAVYKSARELLDQGNVKDAVSKIELGIAREPSWRFRLLRAEAFNLQGDSEGALKALDAPPPPVLTEDRSRLALLRAQAAFNLSKNDQAEVLLNEAQELAHPLASPLLAAEIELWRGNVQMRQNRPKEAEQSFLNTLKIANDQGNPRLKAMATGSLGVLLWSTQRCDKAINWFEQALSAFEQLGSAPKVGKTMGNLGWCYFQLGDTDKASEYLRKAEASAQAAANPLEQQAWLGDLGRVLRDTGDTRGAADAFRQALAASAKAKDLYWMRQWSIALADAQIELEDLDGANQSSRGAAEIEKTLNAAQKDPASDLSVPLIEARIEMLRGSTAHAEKLYRAMLLRPYGEVLPILNAHSDLARLLAKTGKTVEADRQFREALTLISSQQADLVRLDFRLSYLSSVIAFCDNYVDFLVQDGETDRALEVTESVRARLLNEGASQSGAGPPVSVAALVRAARTSGSLFLSYWLAPQKSYLWVVRPRGVELYLLPPAKQIAGRVAAYRSLVENLRDPLESENPAGKQLSEILLGPIKDELRKGAKFVVAPDRDLHSLNLEALPDPNDPTKYLIETVSLSIAPSLTMLASRERGVMHARGSLLLIGDPESASPEYPRLPNASREIALISQSFPAGQLVVRSGNDAIPKSYLEASPGRFSAIHFAVHANASRESPLDSALILSPSPSGYTLTAREVMSAPLRADLVTLSACRSAGAKTYSGEGLVGLSWAFLRAGASSVVAGLWDVTDLSTANLMGDFYAQMAAGVAPAEALRSAKLKLVHSSGAYRKPFYWAPFQLYSGRL